MYQVGNRHDITDILLKVALNTINHQLCKISSEWDYRCLFWLLHNTNKQKEMLYKIWDFVLFTMGHPNNVKEE